MIDKLGLDGLGGASVRVEPTPQGTNGVTGKADAGPVVVGLEPVAWYLENEDEYMSEKLRKEHERLNSYTFKLCKVAHPLYSAATVERLVQERDGWIDSAREFSNGMEYYRDQLDACARHIGLPCFTADDGGVHEEPLRAKVAEEVQRLVQERDRLQTIDLDLQMAVQKLAAMTQERDELREQITEVPQIIRQLNAKGQAREQQLREALKQVKHRLDCNGISGRQLPEYRQIDAALALPQDDTALNTLLAAGQVREQQLREALEICKKEMQGDKWDALYIDGVLASK